MFGFWMRLRATLSKIGAGKSQACCSTGIQVSGDKRRADKLSRWLVGLNGDMLKGVVWIVWIVWMDTKLVDLELDHNWIAIGSEPWCHVLLF